MAMPTIELVPLPEWLQDERDASAALRLLDCQIEEAQRSGVNAIKQRVEREWDRPVAEKALAEWMRLRRLEKALRDP